MHSLGAPIISLEEFAKLRPTLKGTIVLTTGPFDPIHPGHISCIQESKQHGDILVVAVNGDQMLKLKKGKSFQNLATRAMIVSAVRGIDYVVPFEVDDISATAAIRAVKPNVFTKGGDRTLDTLPKSEQEAIKELDITFVPNVGMDKHWSSSTFLNEWAVFVYGKNTP